MTFIRQIAIFVGASAIASVAMAAESSVPQMNPVSYPGQLVWLAISFALLYLIVSTVIAPGVGGVLAAREAAITEAIAKAEELKAAASTTRGDFEAAGAEARSEAALKIAQAQADAAAAASAALSKLASELEAKAEASRQEIAHAIARAQLTVDDAAQALSQAMVERLIGGSAMRKITKKAS